VIILFFPKKWVNPFFSGDDMLSSHVFAWLGPRGRKGRGDRLSWPIIDNSAQIVPEGDAPDAHGHGGGSSVCLAAAPRAGCRAGEDLAKVVVQYDDVSRRPVKPAAAAAARRRRLHASLRRRLRRGVPPHHPQSQRTNATAGM
jgi:hypothetical protein